MLNGNEQGAGGQAGSDEGANGNGGNSGGTAGNDDFKVLQERLAAQESEIKKLRKEAGDRRTQKNEAETKALTLEQKFDELNKKYEATHLELKTQKIVSELTKAGCLNPDLAAKAKPEDAELSEWITGFKKDNPYLFKAEQAPKRNTFKPSGANGKTESFGDLFNSAFRGE